MIGPLAWLRRDSRWTLACLALIFVAMLVANTALVVVSLGSFTGLVTDHSYAKGLAYNHVLADARAQAALGWRVAIAFEPTAPGAGRLVVEVADGTGRPLAPARLDGRLVRPAAARADVALDLRPAGVGRWTADIAPPAPGLWEVRVTATRGADRLVAAERIVVR
jgi:nitrogen fixation protein FixH